MTPCLANLSGVCLCQGVWWWDKNVFLPAGFNVNLVHVMKCADCHIASIISGEVLVTGHALRPCYEEQSVICVFRNVSPCQNCSELYYDCLSAWQSLNRVSPSAGTALVCSAWEGLTIQCINCSMVGHLALTWHLCACWCRSLYINLVGLWAILVCATLCGLSLYSIYKDCDPWTAKQVSALDQVQPHISMRRKGQLSPWGWWWRSRH